MERITGTPGTLAACSSPSQPCAGHMHCSLPAYIGTKIIGAEPMLLCDFEAKYKNIGCDQPEGQKQEGYHVEYYNPDGVPPYHSWSPKNVFENAYRKVDDGITFGDALVYLKQGKGVRLPSWSNDVAIYCQFPDENSKMTAPYLYVESRFGRVPWKETMIELFSESWMVIE